MTPHRSDLEAAHARVAALERELAAATARSRRPLVCTACRARFELTDLADGVLACRGCGAALEIGRPPPPRPRRDCPPDVRVDTDGGQFRISWRWQRSLALVVTALFAAVFAGAMAANADLPRDRGAWTAIAIVAAVFVAIALYDYIAHRVNRTEITVSDTTLTISHGPMPYALGQRIARQRIAQLYVEPRSDSGITFGLVAVADAGVRVPLVRLASVARAFYLEQELEIRLGIEDRPVAGEEPRS